MKITFYGQLGLPRAGEGRDDSRERRTEALGRELAKQGHRVTVLATKPYAPASHYQGITVKKLFSLNPDRPGGFIYLLLGWLNLWKERPDTIHVQGFAAAWLARVYMLLRPETGCTWTIDRLPGDARLMRFSLRRLFPLFDAVTVTTREVQYRVLCEYGLKAAYIPDGYDEAAAPNIRPAVLGLKKHGYALVLANAWADTEEAAKAYAALKTQKKLVAALEAPASRYWRKKYPRLSFIGRQGNRRMRSLIAGAAVVIMPDGGTPAEQVLWCMEARQVILAANYPLYQEMLGTTARFYRAGDAIGLNASLRAVMKNANKRDINELAQKRAKNHFLWQRLSAEYAALYAPERRLVAMDSIQPVTQMCKTAGVSVE